MRSGNKVDDEIDEHAREEKECPWRRGTSASEEDADDADSGGCGTNTCTDGEVALPQHMLVRVAVGIHGNDIDHAKWSVHLDVECA